MDPGDSMQKNKMFQRKTRSRSPVTIKLSVLNHWNQSLKGSATTMKNRWLAKKVLTKVWIDESGWEYWPPHSKPRTFISSNNATFLGGGGGR